MSDMNAPETPSVLDALRGTYRLTAPERVAAAFQAFWVALAAGSIALGLAVIGVSALPRVTWSEVVESVPYAVGFNAAFVLAGIAALAAATRACVVTDHEVAIRFGNTQLGWSVSRRQIAKAAVVQGMFRRTLVLSLRDGAEKRFALPKSMLAVLECSDIGPPRSVEWSGT